MKKIYGYARVSTREQHLDRQIKALRDHGIEERDIVTDHASGANLERPGYTALKGTMLRDGDTLVVKSLDRLSRNKEHIIQELQYFKNHHIKIQVLDLPTTMIDLPDGQQWVFDKLLIDFVTRTTRRPDSAKLKEKYPAAYADVLKTTQSRKVKVRVEPV